MRYEITDDRHLEMLVVLVPLCEFIPGMFKEKSSSVDWLHPHDVSCYD